MSWNRKTLHQRRIERAMLLGGQAVPHQPTVPSDEVRLLRAKLILEEALETIEGLGVAVSIGGRCILDPLGQIAEPPRECWIPAAAKVDLEKVVDGCGDHSVVTIGTLSAFGIGDRRVLDEVDTANLRKFEPPKCAACGAEMTKRSVWEDSSSANGGQVKLERWVCLRNGPTRNEDGGKAQHGHPTRALDEGPWNREDGKYMKPPYWKKPDIMGAIQADQEMANRTDWTRNQPPTWLSTVAEFVTPARWLSAKEYDEAIHGRFVSDPHHDHPELPFGTLPEMSGDLSKVEVSEVLIGPSEPVEAEMVVNTPTGLLDSTLDGA